MSKETTVTTPTDPLHPKLAETEPTWVKYATTTVASLVILVGARFGLDLDGDEALLAGFLSGPILYGLNAWRTRRTVYAPATVARLEHWQATGHDGVTTPKSTLVQRPERPTDLP